MIEFRIINTTLLCMVAPFLVWPASALLVNTAFGRWCVGMSRYSFFIFVAHAPLLLGPWLVYKKLAAFLPYPVYWALAPLLTAAMLIYTYSLAQRLVPRAFEFMLGKRVARPGRATAPLRPATLAAAPLSTRANVLDTDDEALQVQ